MELEVGGVCKAFIAVCALKRSLSRMGAFVLITKKIRHEKKEDVLRSQFVISIKKVKTLHEFLAETVPALLTCFRFDV